MKKLLLLILLALPMLSATARNVVRVTAPCTEGNAFTLSIPFKLPPEIDTVWYRWYYNGHAAPVEEGVAAHDSRKITYTIPADSAYGVDVEAYFDYRLNDECCDAWTKSPVYVMTFLECIPPVASAIAGSTSVCASAAGLTYSVDSVADVYYEWAVPYGWTITAGQGTHSITVTTGMIAIAAAPPAASSSPPIMRSPPVSGSVSVTPKFTANSCTGETRTLAVVVNDLPPEQPSAIAGSDIVCGGQTGITYSVASVAGTTYDWTLPTGWTKTAGGTTSSITVTVGSTAGSVNISVTPGNGCGIGTAEQTMAVTVTQAPSFQRSGFTNRLPKHCHYQHYLRADRKRDRLQQHFLDRDELKFSCAYGDKRYPQRQRQQHQIRHKRYAYAGRRVHLHHNHHGAIAALPCGYDDRHHYARRRKHQHYHRCQLHL